MSQPLLSILIPTVEERGDELNKLVGKINRICFEGGYEKEVEVKAYKDNKEMTIGEKRETLYQLANGIYSWQIDDDDDISDNAIELILKSAKEPFSGYDTDCITFEEHIDIDGKIQRSNHSLQYDDWHDNFDGFDYVRTPFFKSVIKTGIAKSVPIPHIRFGEDHQWAQALKPHLKSEIHIPEQLYRYIHKSTPHNERYGFDRE